MKAVSGAESSPEMYTVPVVLSRSEGPTVKITESFIDAAEAATFIGLHRKTLLRLAREGEIPAHPLTGRRRRIWRFLISELDAWARSRVNSGCDRCQNSRS